MAILVAMATVHEKIPMIFPIKLLFHILHLYDGYTKFIKKVMIRNSRWLSCPYMVKTFKRRLLQNHHANLADILQEAHGAPPYIK